MASYRCPKGHDSTEPDFCSECGTRILPAAPPPRPVGPGPAGMCPDCQAPRMSDDAIYCEVCGFNFATGEHGEIPVAHTPPAPVATPAVAAAAPAPPTPPAAPPAPAAAPTAPAAALPPKVVSWTIRITVDPSLQEPGSPAPPGFEPTMIALSQEVNVIGRTSKSRHIYPEVPIDADDAVSHRHAVLTRNGEGGLVLRDVGSSNGTRLNGKDVAPLTDVILHDGDEITLGHWTRLMVKSAEVG